MPISDKDTSRIKLLALTSGKNENIVWYSIISKDHQEVSKIINQMLKRFSKFCNDNPTIKKTINKIYIYDNRTKNKLGEAEVI